MIEKMIIEHCSPTLASIKTGNLFTITFDNQENLFNDIIKISSVVENAGIIVRVINIKNNSALIYLCRKSLLQKELSNQQVRDFLCSFGYNNFTLEYVLDKLEQRIKSNNGFPHEIGVFLGYPLEDVKAFIINKGKNYNCCGYWKVYENPTESLKKFALFDKCRRIYQTMWENGRSISQLTIVA